VRDIELLVLRHELGILRRQVAQLKLGMADRAFAGRCSRSSGLPPRFDSYRAGGD
jgi:hypothetical protein